MRFPAAARRRVHRLASWLVRPYRVLVGREVAAPSSRGRAGRDRLPWWLPVGMVAGIVVYATVLTIIHRRFGTIGIVLVTLVFAHYCARLWAAALLAMS
jgi:hypothetical protein